MWIASQYCKWEVVSIGKERGEGDRWGEGGLSMFMRLNVIYGKVKHQITGHPSACKSHALLVATYFYSVTF